MRASEACALVAIAISIGACVPRDAGFSDVSRTVSRRAGHRARWRAIEDDPGVIDAELRRLIAQPLDPDEATRVALLNNPALQASFEDLGVARGRLLAASVPPNPEIEGEVYLPIDQSGDPDFEAGALYDLGALVRLPIRRAAAESELSAARMRAASEVLDLALAVRVAFYDYLADRRVLDLLRDIVSATRASWEAAGLLFEAGNVRQLDVAQQRALYEEARVALAQAELALLEDREQLHVLMGLYGADTEWTTDAELDEPPPQLPELDRIEARAIEASLALEALRYSAQAAAQRIGLARNQGAMPRIEVGAALRREDGAWAAGPAASVTLPLFDQNLGAIEATEAELRALRDRHEATAIRVRSRVRRARNRLLNAHERVRFYRETLLPVRQEVLEQTLLQYNAMQIDVFQLLAARRAQIETALDYVDTLREAWIARAVLEQILAGGGADPGELLGAPASPRLTDTMSESADEH